MQLLRDAIRAPTFVKGRAGGGARPRAPSPLRGFVARGRLGPAHGHPRGDADVL